MMQGIDCATPLTPELAAKFKASGCEFVCRYLVPSGWKALTRAEAEAISGADMQVISVFETSAGRPLGGYEAGLQDGATALQVAAEVGQPLGSCIYFAVDFDATPEQMWTIIDYLRGCREAAPGYSIGVYGSYNVMMALGNAGAADKYWQTYAWSGNRRADFINLFQYKNDVPANGIQVDHNMAYGDEGGWSLAKPEPPAKKTEFSDVEAGRWSEDVIWVVNYHGIMTGFEDGTFRPEQPVTREELAAALNALYAKFLNG
ncbi:glycoside hydrolase domain-containing protein [Paenibacillus sp. HJGM_3]|uniref:glycoside hydrolase domain-containing protein n=1 Tax=Paenibacillus sp. HJGM_3 TaxID=3379816 RepID=UPI0038580223